MFPTRGTRPKSAMPVHPSWMANAPALPPSNPHSQPHSAPASSQENPVLRDSSDSPVAIIFAVGPMTTSIQFASEEQFNKHGAGNPSERRTDHVVGPPSGETIGGSHLLRQQGARSPIPSQGTVMDESNSPGALAASKPSASGIATPRPTLNPLAWPFMKDTLPEKRWHFMSGIEWHLPETCGNIPQALTIFGQYIGS